MQIFSTYYWEKGFKTEKNQDSLALCQMVVQRKRCLMAVVCDGIGSLPDAEKASGFVTEQLVYWFYHTGPRVFTGYFAQWRIPNVALMDCNKSRDAHSVY